VGCQKSIVPVTSGLAGLASGDDAPALARHPLRVRVVCSSLHLALGRVLELVMLDCRSTEAKESRSSCHITNSPSGVARIHGGCHPRIALLAALRRQLPRARWSVF
jgi:hypothetical protein